MTASHEDRPSTRQYLLAALILIVASASCVYAFSHIVPMVIEHGQIG